jgi:hypothetical protein
VVFIQCIAVSSTNKIEYPDISELLFKVALNIHIVVVRFIGGGNQRKPPTCHKSLTNFITKQIRSNS